MADSNFSIILFLFFSPQLRKSGVETTVRENAVGTGHGGNAE
jgi:hypothetical protein